MRKCTCFIILFSIILPYVIYFIIVSFFVLDKQPFTLLCLTLKSFLTYITLRGGREVFCVSWSVCVCVCGGGGGDII